MTTVYVALYDENWNNDVVTGVYADIEHAKAALAEEYQRPGRTLEWREHPPGFWCLYALGEGRVIDVPAPGGGTHQEGGPDLGLDVSIQAHEVKP